MNLCFITREVAPNLMGGIGTYVANVTELLAKEGHSVTLLTAWHPDAPARGLEQAHICDNGIRIYYLPFVLENWAVDPAIDCPEVIGLSQLDVSSTFAWTVADALEVLIPRHDFAYIEAPEYEAPLSIFLNRRAGLPAEDPLNKVVCVVHLHSPSHLIFENNDDDTSSAWIQHRRRFELESIRRADAVLAPSAYLANQVAGELGIDPAGIQVIPYPLGRPLPEWHFDESRPDGFHCLYVGRIEPRKGAFEWVEATSEVARDYPDTFFHFVGGPHTRETREEERSTAEIIQSFIPADLTKQFIFHKHMPREELGRHYYHADLCVVPSRWDNYPNTCMEAMRCGKPVLASNQGGMAEMIEDGHSGWLARSDYGDRQSLKEALHKTLVQAIAATPTERAKLGKAARERIEKICDNRTILETHKAWRASLSTASSTAPKTALGRIYVAIFLTSSIQPDSIQETLESVAAQEGVDVVPVLVHNMNTQANALPEFTRSWASLPGNPEDAQHPTGYSKDIFSRLLGNFGNEDDYWCFLTPGMKIRPAFAKVCRQTLLNCPTDGFCLPWIYDKDKNRIVARSGIDDNELLLHPKNADLFGLFRHRDLAPIFRESPNGYYLGDILRDCMLKLFQAGKTGVVVPNILGDSARPLDPCCLSNFCFHHPADSHFQLLAAHKAKLDLNHFLHQHAQRAHSPAGAGVQAETFTTKQSEPASICSFRNPIQKLRSLLTKK